MIRNELSYYSTTTDENQRQFAERLSQQRDGLVGDFGRAAMLAITVGVSEPAPVTHNYEPTAEFAPIASEKHQSALARTAFSNSLIGDYNQPNIAVAHKAALDHAVRSEYSLTA